MTTTMHPESPVQIDKQFANIFLYSGIVLAVIGVIAIAAAMFFTLTSMVFIGALLVAAGVAELVNAYRTRHRHKVALTVVSGLLYLFTGALILYHPLFGAISLTLVIGCFLLAEGVVHAVHAFQRRNERAWGWSLFGGLLNFALGAIILAGWPLTGLWIPGLFIGIEFLTNGLASIALSSALRHGRLSDSAIQV